MSMLNVAAFAAERHALHTRAGLSSRWGRSNRLSTCDSKIGGSWGSALLLALSGALLLKSVGVFCKSIAAVERKCFTEFQNSLSQGCVVRLRQLSAALASFKAQQVLLHSDASVRLSFSTAAARRGGITTV
jgi:hypothetical protein